ncbi:MAG: hypothetical protein V1725_06500 [archaeon]
MTTTQQTAKTMTPLEHLLSGISYIAGNTANMAAYDLSPFGTPLHVIDVLDKKQQPFLNLLHQLDGIAYGDKHLAMPRWVMLDCGLLPSAFVGVAYPAEQLPSVVLEKFSLPHNYTGLVPISTFCALPTPHYAEKGSMVAHTLASVIPGMGFPTKLLGLLTYKAKHITGITQYTNTAVRLHAKIAPLQLVNAQFLLHTAEHTFIYQSIVDEQLLKERLHGVPLNTEEIAPNRAFYPADTRAWQAIQENIEEGFRYYILGQEVMNGQRMILVRKTEWNHVLLPQENTVPKIYKECSIADKHGQDTL